MPPPPTGSGDLGCRARGEARTRDRGAPCAYRAARSGRLSRAAPGGGGSARRRCAGPSWGTVAARRFARRPGPGRRALGRRGSPRCRRGPLPASGRLRTPRAPWRGRRRAPRAVPQRGSRGVRRSAVRLDDATRSSSRRHGQRRRLESRSGERVSSPSVPRSSASESVPSSKPLQSRRALPAARVRSPSRRPPALASLEVQPNPAVSAALRSRVGRARSRPHGRPGVAPAR